MASPSFKFSPDEVASLLDGKVCARVESKRIFREGETFDVEGATFRVLDVQCMTGRESVARVFRLEGCRSPSAFIKRLRLRLGEDAVSIGSIVYVHYFARVTELQNVSKSTEIDLDGKSIIKAIRAIADTYRRQIDREVTHADKSTLPC